MVMIKFAARKNGVMKLFKTEEEASAYADAHTTIARYSTNNGTDFDFEEVVGAKTDAETIARILES